MEVSQVARNKGGLTAKQRKAVELLINSNMTYQEIADEVGVNRKTLYDWRHEPQFTSFQEEYQRLKQEQWLATVEAARKSALKLCADGNQKMVEFVLKNDGLNPTQKVEADINTDIVINIGEDDAKDA